MPLMMEGSTKEINLGMYKSVLPSTGWTTNVNNISISTADGIYRVRGGSSISQSSINLVNVSGSFTDIVDSSTSTYTKSSDVTSQYGGILITLAKPMAITMIRAKINCTNSTGVRWQVSGSNDEAYSKNWTLLGTSTQFSDSLNTTLTLTNTTKYKYYMVDIVKNTNAGAIVVYGIWLERYLEDVSFSALKLGTTDLIKAYLGTNLVYEMKKPGRFITVGSGGKSAYSLDGITWVETNGLNSSYSYYGVCYGNDRYVCVGANGMSYYSTDCETWVKMTGNTTGSNYHLHGVAYGNDRFVAVGRTKRGYYSLDGETWTHMSGMPEGTSYRQRGVAYGNGRFVAVGDDGKSYYSTNGTSWTAMTGLDTSVDYYGVAYGNGRFVAVGDDGKSYYSTDGTSWVQMSGLDPSISAYGYYNAVAYGNDRFVCVGGNGMSYYSIDGETWVKMSGNTIGTNYSLNGVVYGNDRFVAVGDNGKSYYSTDGMTWTAMSGLSTSYNYNAVAYGEV